MLKAVLAPRSMQEVIAFICLGWEMGTWTMVNQMEPVLSLCLRRMIQILILIPSPRFLAANAVIIGIGIPKVFSRQMQTLQSLPISHLENIPYFGIGTLQNFGLVRAPTLIFFPRLGLRRLPCLLVALLHLWWQLLLPARLQSWQLLVLRLTTVTSKIIFWMGVLLYHILPYSANPI